MKIKLQELKALIKEVIEEEFNKKRKVDQKCDSCGRIFTDVPNTRYCSKKCYEKDHEG
jgi:uncharacterized OB-fold protein